MGIGGQGQIAVGGAVLCEITQLGNGPLQPLRRPGIDHQLVADAGDNIVAIHNTLEGFDGFAVTGTSHQDFQGIGVILVPRLDPVGAEAQGDTGILAEFIHQFSGGINGGIIGLFRTDDSIIGRAVLDDLHVGQGHFGFGRSGGLGNSGIRAVAAGRHC